MPRLSSPLHLKKGKVFVLFSKVTISSRDINCGCFFIFFLFGWLVACFVLFCFMKICVIFNMHSLEQNLVDIEADQYLTEDLFPHSN